MKRTMNNSLTKRTMKNIMNNSFIKRTLNNSFTKRTLNCTMEILIFGFFVWVKLKYNSFTKRTMNNIIDEPEWVKLKYNSFTNRTMNNSFMKRTIRLAVADFASYCTRICSKFVIWSPDTYIWVRPN